MAERKPRLRRTVLCTALLLVASGAAQSARVDYEVDLSYLHSDNINLSEDNEIDESVLIPGLRFVASQEGSAVQLQAIGDLEHRSYLDNNFPDEFRSRLAGQLNWSMLPERLSLVVEDYLNQAPISLREGSYPGNVQRTNVFIAGPTFFARLGDTTRAQIDLRGTDTYAEVTEGFDGQRYSAAGKLQRDFSSTQQGSLNLASTKAEFDNPDQATDFTRHDAFIGYQRAFRTADLELDAGYSRVEREGGGGQESSPLARLGLTWRATGRSQVSVNARRQLSDTVQDLVIRNFDLDDPIIPDLVESAVLVNPQVFRSRRFDVDYRFSGERLSVRVRPTYRERRYIDSSIDDQNEEAAFFEVGYRLRPRLTMGVQAVVRNREFLAFQQENRDRIYSVTANYRMTRHLSLQAAAYRNKRTSTDPDPEYEENSYRASIVWQR